MGWRTKFIVLGVLLSWSAALAPERRDLVFSSPGLELHIDPQTGAWTRLIEKSSGRSLVEASGAAEFFTLAVGGVPSPFPPRLLPPGDTGLSGMQRVGAKLRKTAHSTTDKGDAIVVRVECREGDWSVTFDYRLPHHRARIERRFTIRYDGPGEVLLRGAELSVTLVLQDGDLLEMPVSAVPPSIRLDSEKKRTAFLGPYAPGLVALPNPRLKNALLWWAYSESEFPAALVSAEGHRLKITSRIPLAARMKQGSQVAWGSDYVWPAWRKQGGSSIQAIT